MHIYMYLVWNNALIIIFTNKLKDGSGKSSLSTLELPPDVLSTARYPGISGISIFDPVFKLDL